jgi:tripartite-type tricarboxylate transporter receptor subunit TctC
LLVLRRSLTLVLGEPLEPDMFNRRTLLVGLASVAAASQSGRARAQAYPSRLITLLVPFAAAGGTDIAARQLGESLSQTLGQTIVIENRPGANGIVAGQALLKADPDGYTLLVATAASFAAAPALGQKLPYDVGKDFAPVGMLGLFPLVLNVAPGLPVVTLAEFIAYAKARPGQLNFASAGVGGTNHLVFEMIMRAAGITLAHVPYRGAGLAQADVMSGQVQVMVDSLAASLGNIQGGKLKALAVTTADRQPLLASVPTLKESGVDLVYPGWASIVAHAATPPGVLARLTAAINTAMQSDALVSRYQELVIQPVAWSAAETTRFMAADRNGLIELSRATGIRLEQ